MSKKLKPVITIPSPLFQRLLRRAYSPEVHVQFSWKLDGGSSANSCFVQLMLSQGTWELTTDTVGCCRVQFCFNVIVVMHFILKLLLINISEADLISLTIFGEKYRLWSSSLCIFLQDLSSSLLGHLSLIFATRHRNTSYQHHNFHTTNVNALKS